MNHGKNSAEQQGSKEAANLESKGKTGSKKIKEKQQGRDSAHHYQVTKF
jgi:hypothetical protein